MKSVIKEIVASLEGQAQHKLIEDVRIGLCYTAVILNDGNLGLAYTFPSRGKLHSSCDTLASGSLILAMASACESIELAAISCSRQIDLAQRDRDRLMIS